jgi:hypothetical protein
MSKKFVRVLADVDCEWEGLMPSYRVYVNDELFAERTWRWPGRMTLSTACTSHASA